MALFDSVDPKTVKRRSRIRHLGTWLFLVAVLAACVFAVFPAPYVIEEPGPVFNTLGDVNAGSGIVPMIDIPEKTTYKTGGTFDLLTVSTYGQPDALPNWLDVVSAWLDPSREVLPIKVLYPSGYTVQQSNEDGRIEMENSQKDAVAAALIQLGYDVPSVVKVGSLSEGSPSKGILEPGDILNTVGGQAVDSVDQLRALIGASGAGKPLAISVTRNGQELSLTVTPQLTDTTPRVPIVGIYPAIDYTFPFEVSIQLQNIGGPSGGQMFALGIIDKLTPGELNGGSNVAGTGTIDAEGEIGAIGGIRQKLYGALNNGATWFLAPKSNCNEVVGHVPNGITVVAVSTLKDSLAALKVISSGGSTKSLPSCSAG